LTATKIEDENGTTLTATKKEDENDIMNSFHTKKQS
jgi:hypothetical protein